MMLTGEWGMLKEIPVSATYNGMIYDQTVLGLDYFDCSKQTAFRIKLNIKDHAGHIVNVHEHHIFCQAYSSR